MHPLRLGTLPGIRRARSRLAAIFAEMPVLFFAVVIGIAMTFRVAIGYARGTQEDPSALAPSHAAPPAPTTAITFAPDPATKSAKPAVAAPLQTATATVTAQPAPLPRAKPQRRVKPPKPR